MTADPAVGELSDLVIAWLHRLMPAGGRLDCLTAELKTTFAEGREPARRSPAVQEPRLRHRDGVPAPLPDTAAPRRGDRAGTAQPAARAPLDAPCRASARPGVQAR
jgi:hypothetical protein